MRLGIAWGLPYLLDHVSKRAISQSRSPQEVSIVMRDVSDQAQQGFNPNTTLAQSLLGGMKDLPQSSMEIAPLDPVNMMTKDMNFPMPTVDGGTTRDVSQQAATNDKSVLPEKLDTSKPQAVHAVLQHLKNAVENVANKVTNAFTPQGEQKAGASGADNSNITDHKCPFVRAANAVGFPIGGAGASKSGEAGTGATAPESLRAQSAADGGAPANAVEAAKNGAAPTGACPVR